MAVLMLGRLPLGEGRHTAGEGLLLDVAVYRHRGKLGEARPILRQSLEEPSDARGINHASPREPPAAGSGEYGPRGLGGSRSTAIGSTPRRPLDGPRRPRSE